MTVDLRLLVLTPSGLAAQESPTVPVPGPQTNRDTLGGAQKRWFAWR